MAASRIAVFKSLVSCLSYQSGYKIKGIPKYEKVSLLSNSYLSSFQSNYSFSRNVYSTSGLRNSIWRQRMIEI